MAGEDLAAAAARLTDCSRLLVFDDSFKVLYATFEVDAAELPALALLVGDRDDAVRSGCTLAGKRYEVHRHHTPLVYGRSHEEDPSASEGVALCACARGPTGRPAYAVATYELPMTSARVVPQLQAFVQAAVQK